MPVSPWLRFRRVLDAWTAYLPMLLMGLLAMLTYWLVRHTPEPLQPEPARAVRHVPDYFMRDFSLKVYSASGRLESELLGERAEHFPDTDALHVYVPRIRKVDDLGRLSQATALQAITTPDGERVELVGQVVLKRDSGVDAKGQRYSAMELRSEYLLFDLNTQKLKTDKPVQFQHGSDSFRADALDYDHGQGLLQLTGRVRGRIDSRREKSPPTAKDR